MQKTGLDIVADDYRETLGPSLWILVSAALVAPMAALVLAPIDTTVALIAGGAVGAAVVALLVAASPRVVVRGGVLRAGRAHIDVDLLGDPVGLVGEAARNARGAGLDPRAWHLVRGGIDGLVVVPVIDSVDPTPAWVISTRTPDRLAAAIRRAQLTQRTPSR